MSQPPYHNPCEREAFPASCSKWDWPSPTLPHHSELDKKLLWVPLVPETSTLRILLLHSCLGHHLARSCKENTRPVALCHPAGPSGQTLSWFTCQVPVNQKPELPHHPSSHTLCPSTAFSQSPSASQTPACCPLVFHHQNTLVMHQIVFLLLSPKFLGEKVLTPSISKCDLIWK